MFQSLEGSESFSSDVIRSVYVTLLSRLLVKLEKDATEKDIESIVDTAVGRIDTNSDGMIDLLEKEDLRLAQPAGDFFFDNIVACTNAATNTEDERCVSASNVVDFLNIFFEGKTIIPPDLAQRLVEKTGGDRCMTQTEWQQLFQYDAATNMDTSSSASQQHWYGMWGPVLTVGVASALALYNLFGIL